ncbi:hypothetical protein L7F22_067455 [Adiantum nelumboides]|nr:hypothetical protein [Adiantum nelumboides]
MQVVIWQKPKLDLSLDFYQITTCIGLRLKLCEACAARTSGQPESGRGFQQPESGRGFHLLHLPLFLEIRTSGSAPLRVCKDCVSVRSPRPAPLRVCEACEASPVPSLDEGKMVSTEHVGLRRKVCCEACEGSPMLSFDEGKMVSTEPVGLRKKVSGRACERRLINLAGGWVLRSFPRL